MHVKTLGYPIGCQPEIYNERLPQSSFFIQQGITYALKCLKKRTQTNKYCRAQFQRSTFWVVYATILIYWRANSL